MLLQDWGQLLSSGGQVIGVVPNTLRLRELRLAFSKRGSRRILHNFEDDGFHPVSRGQPKSRLKHAGFWSILVDGELTPRLQNVNRRTVGIFARVLADAFVFSARRR